MNLICTLAAALPCPLRSGTFYPNPLLRQSGLVLFLNDTFHSQTRVIQFEPVGKNPPLPVGD